MRPTRASDNSIPNNTYKFSWILLLPLVIGLFITSCGDDIASPNEKLENATGTIQGEVFDKATGNALSGVQVTVVDTSATNSDETEWSASTNENGVFTIEGIPVTADAKSIAESGGYSNPYTLHLDASSLENYRDSYKAVVDVVFESTGGDGAVTTDIVSKVKLPLSEQSVTLTGTAQTNNDKIISGATVKLYQYFNPVINGSRDTQTEMLLTSTETGEDGSFSFEGVEEDSDIYLKFSKESDPADVVSGRYPDYGAETTPSGSEENPTMDLGVINFTPVNQSGAFYVTDVAPSPEANIGKNQEFMYVFNRPVAENPYTNASASFGVGSMKDDMEFQYVGEKSFKSPGDVEFDVSWGDTRDTLFVEPEISTMKDGAEYELRVDAFNDDRFADQYGNNIEWGASEYDDFEVEDLTFYTNFNTKAPHTPSLAVDSTSLNTDWNDGSLTMEWTMTHDPAEVKEYELYISRDGGAYQHMQTVDADYANHGKFSYTFYARSNPLYTNWQANDPNYLDADNTFADILMANEDDIPVDEAHSHKVKVRAISKNLVEGDFSDPITVEDVTNPGLFGGADQGTAGDNNEDHLYLDFDEPMDKSTAENTGHYTITDDTNGDISISSVTYDRNGVNNPANGQTYDLVIVVDNAGNLTTGDIEVESDVTDLTGNGMDENDNTAAY